MLRMACKVKSQMTSNLAELKSPVYGIRFLPRARMGNQCSRTSELHIIIYYEQYTVFNALRVLANCAMFADGSVLIFY